jgi:glycosyltransferase involved in cell wall biosynthesis
MSNMTSIPLKVLYLSYDGMTDALGESQVVSYLRGLSEKGYEITIISFEKESAYALKKNSIQQILKEHGISWYPYMYTKNPPVISTIIDLWRMRKKAIELQKITEFNIVHCRSYISSIVGLYLKKLTHGSIKFIFDMRGFWIEERIEGGMWNVKNPLYRGVVSFFKSNEKRFYQKSDKIISLTNAAKSYIVNNKDIVSSKIGVIPTCVDFDLFKITDLNEQIDLRQQLGIKANTKVFVYAGAIGGSYNIDLILQVYQQYKSFFIDTHLLLLTKDPLSVEGHALVDRLNINKDEFSVVESPFKKVYKYLNIGNIGFVFYSKGWSNIARSPTKMGEYLACGLPVLVYGNVGDIDTLQTHLEIFIIKDISRESCFSIFKQISKGDKTTDEMRNEAYAYCSLEKGVEFYAKIYEELTQAIQ